MKKIQTDDKKPNQYANDPHELTHIVDGLRYYSIYWTHGAKNPSDSKRKKWRADQWEDYRNANAKDRQYLISIWGEPR